MFAENVYCGTHVVQAIENRFTSGRRVLRKLIARILYNKLCFRGNQKNTVHVLLDTTIL